jgi:hypothetical protein
VEAWSASALDRTWRDELDAWPIALALDGVTYCHGSSRRDDEVLTRVTPDDVIREALTGVSDPSSSQVIPTSRTSAGCAAAPTYVTAGSIGIPARGGPEPSGRSSTPAAAAAQHGVRRRHGVAELQAFGFADVDGQVGDSLIEPVDADWVAAFFEHTAGRGPDPVPPPPRSRGEDDRPR